MVSVMKGVDRKTAFLLVILAVAGGCAGPPAREGAGEGRKLLDRLRAGMELGIVTEILGEPSTYVEIRVSRFGTSYHQITYANTIINPGIVELFFEPRLIEIRLDNKIYRDFRKEQGGQYYE